MTSQIIPTQQSSLGDIKPYKQASVTIFTPQDVQAAKYIKMLLSYGDKLTDANALALSAYSRIHGLDPYNGECWFLVREKKNDRGETTGREELGVMPGIKGLRKKAREQMRGIDTQAHYWIEYEQSDAKSAGVDPTQTAVVYKATLRDSISMGQYILNTVRLAKAGYTKEEIRGIVGEPPAITGFGVVRTQETRYLKQAPVTVAKKRAEADVTRQRFDLGALGDTAEESAPDALEAAETAQPNRQPAAEIVQGNFRPADTLAELGFSAPAPAPTEPVPQPFTAEDIQPGEFRDAPPEPVEPPAATPKDSYGKNLPPAAMTLAEAKNVLSSDGKTHYGDIPSDKLAHMLTSITKAMPDAATDKLHQYELKAAAIKLILASRNGK